MQVWIKDYDTKSDILKRSKKNEYPVGWVGKIGAHWTLFIKAYEMILGCIWARRHQKWKML